MAHDDNDPIDPSGLTVADRADALRDALASEAAEDRIAILGRVAASRR